MKKFKDIIALLRIKHYIKNTLIFIPLIFSGELFNKNLVFLSFSSFLFFSAISSIVYIINDWKDCENDKKDEVKKRRPIASGAISKRCAGKLIAFTWGGVFLIAYVQCRMGVELFKIAGIPLIYLAINIGYSFGIKNIPIADVLIISLGFILRTLYGGIIINVGISSWVYLTVITGSLYLGLGKRKKEFQKADNASVRKVLAGYTNDFLNNNMYMCLSLCLMFYSLACIDLKTKPAQMGGNLLWTVPVVLLISLKYNLNLESKVEGDPTTVIWGDRWLMTMILLLIAGIIYTIYYA